MAFFGAALNNNYCSDFVSTSTDNFFNVFIHIIWIHIEIAGNYLVSFSWFAFIKFHWEHCVFVPEDNFFLVAGEIAFKKCLIKEIWVIFCQQKLLMLNSFNCILLFVEINHALIYWHFNFLFVITTVLMFTVCTLSWLLVIAASLNIKNWTLKLI